MNLHESVATIAVPSSQHHLPPPNITNQINRNQTNPSSNKSMIPNNSSANNRTGPNNLTNSNTTSKFQDEQIDEDIEQTAKHLKRKFTNSAVNANTATAFQKASSMFAWND